MKRARICETLEVTQIHKLHFLSTIKHLTCPTKMEIGITTRSVDNTQKILYFFPIKLTNTNSQVKSLYFASFVKRFSTTTNPSKNGNGDLIACAIRITLIRHFMNFIALFYGFVSPRLSVVLAFTVSIVAIAVRLHDFSTLRSKLKSYQPLLHTIFLLLLLSVQIHLALGFSI